MVYKGLIGHVVAGFFGSYPHFRQLDLGGFILFCFISSNEFAFSHLIQYQVASFQRIFRIPDWRPF